MCIRDRCDAAMIARGALGNPWIFKEINQHINSIEKAKLDLSDDARTIELKNWLNYLKN